MKRRILPLMILTTCAFAACSDSAEPEPSPAAGTSTAAPLPEGTGTREDPYVGRGFIEEIGESAFIIRHETIPGFMAAMSMAFPVTTEVDTSEFSVGDQILFDIELDDVNGYQIFSVEPVE